MITTAIGSVPWTDPKTAVEKTWNAVTVPFWPQLPKRVWYELMIPQFAEGLPGVVFDDGGKKVVCRKDEEAMWEFWSDPTAAGRISRAFAAGLYAALEEAALQKPNSFKTQTTGPITFCCSVQKEDGTPIIADGALREAAWMLLAQKAVWQVGQFKRHSRKIYHFFDEPVMAAWGAYPTLTPQLVVEALRFVFATLKEAHPDVMVGLHCCGNTDWGLVLSAEPDVLSFDAFNYGETLLLYGDALAAHAERSGVFAVGIVPTDAAVADVSCQQLVQKAQDLIDSIVQKAGQQASFILTPSCGAGSLNEEMGQRVFNLLQEVGDILRA
ncbi:MAG: hypothetical protein DRP63_06990 [Planctomycetota bacterium]|nr:MAG: hypothetical protein DRP63_06990 [Planctomycetota bacterium]